MFKEGRHSSGSGGRRGFSRNVAVGHGIRIGPGPKSDTAVGRSRHSNSGRFRPNRAPLRTSSWQSFRVATTIPAILEDKGIDLSVFHQAVADARQAALDEAVAAGTGIA